MASPHHRALDHADRTILVLVPHPQVDILPVSSAPQPAVVLP